MEQHTTDLETVKPRAAGRQKTLYKVQGPHGPQVRGQLPFPEVHDDGEEGHDRPVEDAAIQVALCNGSKNGILVGLRDVHLPTEGEPVTGRGSRESRTPLWPPRTFKTTPSPEGRSFLGAARERTSG